MEYSLQNLSSNALLKEIKLSTVIDQLNLIGFEVDDIFLNRSTINSSTDNCRLLIKIPSNRDDLLVEKFFLSELSIIFLFELYQIWKKIKKDYKFILKKVYSENLMFYSKKLSSELDEINFYMVELSPFNQLFSPIWVQQKLKNSGITVKNHFEDVLKLIELEWGQTIQIITSEKNEKIENFHIKQILKLKRFQDLNNQSIIVQPGTIVVCNESGKIYNFLGSIQNDFNFQNEKKWYLSLFFYDIHQNLLNLNPLETQISLRFLRKTFLENIRFGFQRLLTILELSYGAKILPTIYSSSQFKPINQSHRILKLKIKSFQEYLNIEKYEKEIFKRAGLSIVCRTPHELYFQIPFYRVDLKREVDLIEEYSRFMGYKNFPEIIPNKSLIYSKKKTKNIAFIRQFFLNHSFHEVLTNPIQEKTTISSILITNPLTKELSVLRTELLSKIIQIFLLNKKNELHTQSFFEIGRTFQKKNAKCVEIEKLGGIFQSQKSQKNDFDNSEWFKAKGFLENFLNNFDPGKHPFVFKKVNYDISYLHPTRAVEIIWLNKTIGIFGETNPKIAKLCNSKFSTYVFELDLQYLNSWQLNHSISVYKDYPKYPSILKDISFQIKKETNFYELKKQVKSITPHLKQVNFFDIYSDFNNQNLITIGLRLEFQSNEETLKNEKIEEEVSFILNWLIEHFNIILKI